MTATMPPARHVPLSWAGPLKRRQGIGVPLFSPAPLLRGDDARHLKATPLYAGRGVARLESVAPAAEALPLLTL
jgi:hypothetical protein